ncbi:MAG: aconitase family protein, partial [Desulfobacteraceae bacterium]
MESAHGDKKPGGDASFPFNIDEAQRTLDTKRERLGRGLSYAEKILCLHQVPREAAAPGKDEILRLSPDRVAMQDATAQMAMLQFMLAGRDRTTTAATIHCDHLILASEGAEADLKAALRENREVYEFLASAAARYGVGFWGPGSGIIHQVILENYALPGGLMIGTDSHTPNAGGLGMLAIGVGGADAAEVMAGLAWETPRPRLMGVNLRGRLSGWATAKDLILEMLRRFTVKGGTGMIIEYFGEGAGTLCTTEKATIANMGAELGATTSVFVYDQTMDEYLRNTGRSRAADWARAAGDILCQDPVCLDTPDKVFQQVVDLDLGSIEPSHAGPFSPDRVIPVRDFRRAVEAEDWPLSISAILIGSCTNSSYPDLCAAADVLDQGARHGLRPKVPVLLSPGSHRIRETIRRDGILARLKDSGALALSASCGPCIGQWLRRDVKKGAPNCIFTTFNRNFRGRNDANPETRAFLTSPVLAAALALSGDPGFNPVTDELIGARGERFRLEPPTPPDLPEKGLEPAGQGFVPPPEDGTKVKVKIPRDSERLQFLEPFPPWDGEDFKKLPVLVKTKGKTTTDHISPGGAWLRFRGHLANISENLLEGAVNAFTGEAG